ncbi:flotillin family protein [Leptothoe sp. PORK10 BA2]|uniref:flotillin family protein n=1 Tax=Leptothoe sp. PORK10 BA2 TaxID=3110254 RepID=UPI002B1F3803|nr:SPFH domain-containing protein [Leptothoe sp. PORK10 BA2]MEA5465995.1 SPFH domain-containing protein [Leptothoe sp. PORK10 BA2]
MTHNPFLLGQMNPLPAKDQSRLAQAETTSYSEQTLLAQALPINSASQSTAQVGAFLGGSALVLGLIGVGALILVLKTCLRICNPNQILIISGRKYKNKQGQNVGYRVIFGGRTLVVPIIEQVQSMDMTTMPIPVEVTNAYAKGGTPLNIQAIANVKISSDHSVVGNAIERFLGRNRSEIRRVVRETLEGYLRGVVALLTPEQVNEDRMNFAERIAIDVAKDLSKLGLHLDTLKIQSVTDDMDYLSSIGRRQIAHIIRDAEIAEAEAVGEADRIEADCQKQAEVAKTQALTVVQQKQNELRKVKAQLEERAKSEEERTAAAAKESRARAEQQLQTVRAELERLRLEADQVLPAQADRQAKELYAKGQAAALEENAKAAALVNTMLAEVWATTGTDATQVFLIQQIDMVLKEAAKIPGRLHLKKINVIDRGDGKAISSLMNVYPDVVRQFLQQVDDTLGIDVTGTLHQSLDFQRRLGSAATTTSTPTTPTSATAIEPTTEDHN